MLIRIEGDLDFQSAPLVREDLLRVLARGHPEVIIDLGACSFVDSSGLMALLLAERQASLAGAALSLRNPSTTLVRMMKMNHLGRMVGGSNNGKSRLKYPPDTAIGRWEVARFVTPATAQFCAAARRAVLAEMERTPLDPDARADVELAVGEAFANAVRHGSPRGEQDQVSVRSLRGGDAFVVEVADAGHGFDRAQVILPVPDEIREGGMGIFYMEALMDHVDFDSTPQGTTVRMVKQYPRPQQRTAEAP